MNVLVITLLGHPFNYFFVSSFLQILNETVRKCLFYFQSFIRPLNGTFCPFDTECLCGPCNYRLPYTLPSQSLHHHDYSFQFNQGRLCVHYGYDIVLERHVLSMKRNSIPFPREEFELKLRPFSNFMDAVAFEKYLQAGLHCDYWPPE